ncbi:uncharacterized protein LOC130789185 [Actinidia eriantha]|uniref:uncharacterized protein LOC130789185 n=1 Tax=Actinidia eriantha TaxID=165200 RepID=UPI00258A3937|nr:uncharacterized protein LOC130789185 [Actinidia eriantha]XP_057505889.1 uncharacterized protein LOC130789185 [Actinidia eriantha]
MSNKAPKTIFTDRDGAMAKTISIVLPDKRHRLCTWHLMQNAVSLNPRIRGLKLKASGMHNSMHVMYTLQTNYVALPIQGSSSQALSLHGYRYVEGTSNSNNCALAIQGANGQVITSNGYGRVEETLNIIIACCLSKMNMVTILSSNTHKLQIIF